MNALFIYCKNDRFRVIGLPSKNDPVDEENKLITDGWKLTASINPTAWLEYFLNDTPEAQSEAIRRITTIEPT